VWFDKEIRTAWDRIPGDIAKLTANYSAGQSLCEHAFLGGWRAEGCSYSSVRCVSHKHGPHLSLIESLLISTIINIG
jgi:hypothetical protein